MKFYKKIRSGLIYLTKYIVVGLRLLSESDGSSTAKENPKKPDDNKNPNDASNAGNADVLHYCTLFGAPVMYNNTQVSH